MAKNLGIKDVGNSLLGLGISVVDSAKDVVIGMGSNAQANAANANAIAAVNAATPDILRTQLEQQQKQREAQQKQTQYIIGGTLAFILLLIIFYVIATRTRKNG